VSTPALGALSGVLPADAFREGLGLEKWAVGGSTPEAVVEPGSLEEVRAVLAAAVSGGFSVVPLGGRTDPGAEPPRGRFVVLSTRRLDGIEEYAPADLTVTAKGGTTLQSLDAALAEQGQWLPVDPPFAPRRTVGGLVATGAAGALGMAYGTPRDHVLGLTVVTGDGRVLRLGGRVMKNVAGFDLVKLMVGSRGTLGVVVSACMRLFPRPADERVLLLSAESPGALLEAARRVLTASVVPASALLLAPAPASSGGGALVVRVQGARAAVDADARKLLGPSLPRAQILDGPEAQRLLTAARDHATGHRVVVRASALPGLLPEVLSAIQENVPVATVAADVMSGRVRVGLEPSDSDPTPLLLLRDRLRILGGSLVLERMEPWQAYPMPAYGSRGRPGALDRALRARFDPGGILSPGRFET